MFKNMKLSMKITIGFGFVIAIAVIISTTNWYFLDKIEHTVVVDETAGSGITQLLDVRRQEKNFVMRGFEKYEDDTKNSYEKWEDTCKTLDETLVRLDSDNVSKAGRDIVHEAQKGFKEYKDFFSNITKSKQIKDSSFEEWKNLGWAITGSIDTARKEVIAPAVQGAISEQNAGQLAKWSGIADSLNVDVIQNFLLLRVTAIYLIVTNKDAQWEGFTKQMAKTKEGLEKWTGLIQGNGQLEKAVSEISASLAKYENAGNNFYQAVLSERQADKGMVAAARSASKSIEDVVASFKNSLKSSVVLANMLSLIMASCGVVIGSMLAFFIARSITKPIKRIVAGLTEGADQVASASGQVSAASQSLAEGATEQAAGLEETSSSLEEMSSMTKQNADNAQQANHLAGDACKAAENGTAAVVKMTAAIDDIQKSSTETAKIIKVIDEIAFQTNLLALNAAVEAARAGEAGKGFAVVAEEVRNLAQRSAEAAKNTSSMIEQSVNKAKAGVEISAEVSKVLGEIATGITKTSDLVNEIAAASQEQAQGVDQINKAVSQMDKVTQQNAAAAEESASASEELNAQASSMKEIVGELVAIVGGEASVAAKKHNSGISSQAVQQLSKSDELIHQIATGTPKHEKEKQPTVAAKKSAAQKAIPLDDDNKDMMEFNS
jgi:methyl-accepting chemotaxis protein